MSAKRTAMGNAWLPVMVAAVLVSAGGTTAADAQDGAGEGIVFELGAGGGVAPRYEGSKSYLLSPYPIVRLKKLRLGPIDIGGRSGGFFARPSFRFLGERDPAKEPELAGLSKIDRAIELGAGAGFEAANWQVFGDVRRGVTGHEGLTGEVGVDVIARPGERWTLSAGPRASFADAEYMQTYFGVSAAVSLASGLPAFSAQGGLKAVGGEVAVRYEFDEKWAVEGDAAYSRLVGDAADSPVTASRNQWTAKIGLVRTFAIDF